jgi:uncharacterized protein YbaP (TraB family)
MIKRQIAVTITMILFIPLLLLVSACGAPRTVEPTPVVELPPTEVAETPPAVDIEPTSAPPVEPPPAVDVEPESPPPSDDNTKGKSFIWQISSENSTVYLLGSIHVASFGIYPLDSTIEDAFKSADYLVVEVNTNEVDAMESVRLLMEYGTYPEGESLQDNVSEELYVQLEAQLAQWNIDIAELDMFKPWVIYNLLEQVQIQELDYHAEYGIDLYFIEKAIRVDKDIIELETFEFQLELISSLLDEIVILLLEEDITEPMTKDYLDMLFETWENGDAAELERMIFESLTEEPALAPFYYKTLDERNISWAEKIEEFLADEETYFVVVGAGHLVGENGLINILDERGYVTEQLYDSD